jgi:F420-dependent oxidoreductase-like protein
VDVRVLVEPQQGATYDDLLVVARVSEDAGFDGFFCSDHYLALAGPGLPGPTDAWLSLAGLARETSRVRLGTLMSPVTFRLPGPLAIQVAQLDQMSEGRIELGLGAGWYEAEHSAYGIPFPGVGERFDQLEEQLAIITGLWSAPGDGTFSFAGQHYTLRDAPALPKPVQAHVPILIGGDGKRRTPELAARYASEFNSNYDTIDDVAVRFARVRAACERVGRPSHDLVLSTAHFLIVGSSAAEVQHRVEAMVRIWPGPTTDLLAGSPAEVVYLLGRCAEIGARRVYLRVIDLSDMDQLELIASAVVPQLD